MPLYEYQCKTCGHLEEVMQKLSDPPLVRCESCQTDTMVKLISSTAFVLKGGGWYADAYSSKKPASPTDAKSGEKSGSSGSSEGSAAPSAPAAKSEAASPSAAPTPASKPDSPKSKN